MPSPKPVAAPDVYVEIDMSALVSFTKQFQADKGEVFRTAAERHFKYLRNRYIALSSRTGGGGWAPLQDVTVKRKERNANLEGNPFWILRATSNLLNSLTYKVHAGGYEVGYVQAGATHPYYPITIHQLAVKHQFGDAGSNLPARPIIVQPDNRLLRTIVQDIQTGFDGIIARANRRNRRG